MPDALYSLALLACPVGMGLMMWLMLRGGKQSSSTQDSATDNSGELARLRAEIDQLRAEQRDSARATEPKETGR